MQESLVRAIKEIRGRLKEGIFANEAEISGSVVRRLLKTLGWDVWNPRVVTPEFSIKRETDSPRGKPKAVDYALCYPPDKPSVLIEVKGVGKANARGEEQLFEYCFTQGVPLAVLTDGRSWRFFLPSGQGRFEERCFATVNLEDSDIDESAKIISRYLAFEDVRAGEAQRRAQEDYYAFRRQNDAAANFEKVWVELLREPPEVLKDWFCKRVEQTSDVRPDPRRVEEFIRDQARKIGAASDRQTPPSDRQGTIEPVSEPDKGQQEKFSFTFRGQTERFSKGKELLVGVFERLLQEDAQLYEKLEPRLKGRTRQYLARDRSAIYPNNPKPAKTQSASLSNGWWIGTHSDNSTKREQIQKACQVAGIKFGEDLIVKLGE